MSRRTIVVFLLNDELVYLELEDLVARPVEGSYITLEGVRARVTEVNESIGEFKADGTKRSGMDKLLELLALRFDNQAIALLAKLRNIGSGDQPQVAQGGILLPAKNLIGDFDHALLVVLKPQNKKVTGGILGQLHQLAANSPAFDEAPAAKAAAPIRVGDDAAGE